MTDEARARALAEDVVRQWFTRSCGDMSQWEKWKPIWINQLTEQFAAASAAIREECARVAEGFILRPTDRILDGDLIFDIAQAIRQGASPRKGA